MGQQFSDAARAELTAGISAGDTTFTLVDGSRFPEADAGTSAVGDGNLWFKAVLQDETGFEIVYVRTHAVATTPDTLSNVLRGQEGTTARAFAAGSVVGLRPLAADMDTAINGRQPLLVSGTNIKTVGSKSIVGGGDAGVTAADVGALPADGLLVPAGTANTLDLAAANKAVPITANTSIPTHASVAYPIGTCIILECGGTARTISGPASNSLMIDGGSSVATSFILKANTSVAIRKTDTNAWRVYGDV